MENTEGDEISRYRVSHLECVVPQTAGMRERPSSEIAQDVNEANKNG
jgi:hypothetical protein